MLETNPVPELSVVVAVPFVMVKEILVADGVDEPPLVLPLGTDPVLRATEAVLLGMVQGNWVSGGSDETAVLDPVGLVDAEDNIPVLFVTL